MYRRSGGNLLFLIFFVTAVVCLAANASGDEITDQLAKAIEYYEKGDYHKAADELRWVLTQLETLQGNRLQTFFPDPLENYKAEKTSVTSMPGGGAMATRIYRSEETESVIDIEMGLNSPLIQSMSLIFMNPSISGYSEKQFSQINGYKVLEEYKEDSKTGKMMVLVGDRLLIILEGQNISGLTDLKKYVQKMDLEEMHKTLSE